MQYDIWQPDQIDSKLDLSVVDINRWHFAREACMQENRIHFYFALLTVCSLRVNFLTFNKLIIANYYWCHRHNPHIIALIINRAF